jgi:ABC-type lipoprotein export system ATPase subunit
LIDSRPYISCQDLFKIYKRAELEVVALRGLDLEVHKGDLMAIIGSSGSGKSTLLNVLAGLDKPSAGQVWVGERDLLNISHQDLVIYRRQEVGFVWQDPGRNLVPYLSALENIELPMAIAGVAPGKRRERARALLAVTGLDGKANRHPQELSGGEQQRVAIGVAMANNPPLLLADEPTGELDSQTSQQIFELFRTINRETKVTVVIVTHDQGVVNYVPRVVSIRDGKIGVERLLESNFRREGGAAFREYLVVDKAGRLQLPKEFADRLKPSYRAHVDIEGRKVTLNPPEGERTL